jgi:hypothetical protein
LNLGMGYAKMKVGSWERRSPRAVRRPPFLIKRRLLMATNEDRRHAALRNEYQVCQASVQQLESAVWQSATLIGLASLGTLTLVATSDSSIALILVLGWFSTTGAFIWWRMANRWWSIQAAKIRRMRDIEDELDIPGQTHYVDFLDDLHRGRSSAPLPIDDANISRLAADHNVRIERARALASLDHERTGPREVLRGFRWVTLLAWSIFALARLIPHFSDAFHIFFFILPIRWTIYGA